MADRGGNLIESEGNQLRGDGLEERVPAGIPPAPQLLSDRDEGRQANPSLKNMADRGGDLIESERNKPRDGGLKERVPAGVPPAPQLPSSFSTVTKFCKQTPP